MHSVREGAVTLRVPEQEPGSGETVFFNPEQELNRDLTIAVLSALRTRSDASTYLDAMTASGVRALRAAAADWDVTAIDVDPDAVELARENFRSNDLAGTIRRRDANLELHEHGYDVVDLDPFGTPVPFVDAAFRGARDLLCVTATDTAPLCGAHFDAGCRHYDAVPRNTEYHAEMGLRILLSALARTGARHDVGVRPLLSHATRHYVRTYLELERSASAANAALDELGAVYHCEDCLHRESDPGRIANAPDACPNCESDRVLAAGPLWLGPTRDRPFTEQVGTHVTDDMGTASNARDLVATLLAERDDPTHYDQHRLCKRWGRSATSMAEFLEALRANGFEASRTHYGGTTFKTDATVGEIEAVTG